jgi:MSHA biogenesis protein MshK
MRPARFCGMGKPGLLLLLAVAVADVSAQVYVDPTRPPPLPGAQQESGPVAVPPGPVLQSVLTSPLRRMAIISGRTVRLGDRVGDAVVADIRETEVVLRSGRQTQVLKLFPNVQKRLTSSGVRTNADPATSGR